MFFGDKVGYACLRVLNPLWSFRLLNITVISNSTTDLILLPVLLAQKVLLRETFHAEGPLNKKRL